MEISEIPNCRFSVQSGDLMLYCSIRRMLNSDSVVHTIAGWPCVCVCVFPPKLALFGHRGGVIVNSRHALHYSSCFLSIMVKTD